eukprot:scaffold16537_cov93-Isochrysis_galbana.AAC.2
MAAAVGAAAASHPGGPQQLHLNIDDVASPDAQVRALPARTARLCACVLLLARQHKGFSTDPQPATPCPCRVGGWGPHAARGCATCCGGACVWLLHPGSYSGWRVATVADGAAGGGGACSRRGEGGGGG